MLFRSHFRGFDEYYSIPYGDKTAEFGHWEKGPGMDLFRALEKNLGKLDVIAEDLGLLTDSVIEMVEESGFPGMKVLQFAFSSRSCADINDNIIRSGCCRVSDKHRRKVLHRKQSLVKFVYSFEIVISCYLQCLGNIITHNGLNIMQCKFLCQFGRLKYRCVAPYGEQIGRASCRERV